MTLEILTAERLLPLRHGFFTRKGGASSGVFQGLNCGPGSTDQSAAVQINRERVAAALNVPVSHLLTVHQVHSAHVIAVHTAPPPFAHDATQGPAGANARPRGDALVTAVPGLALAVLTADCAPVLLADHRAGVIGAVHAGWRGALDGVVEATVRAMEALGASAGRMAAVIGPAISQDAYEVGPEFIDRFRNAAAGNERHFRAGQGDRMLFDLPGYVLERLRAAGVEQAEWTRHCTYSDPTLFYSYRRATKGREADYGRLISAIRL